MKDIPIGHEAESTVFAFPATDGGTFFVGPISHHHPGHPDHWDGWEVCGGVSRI